ncbi:DUF6262 family protein [Streptomyces sp. NPDC046751]|uniref:DUF6262 family protein n=1 Tax=unclassified Streptomyces TaxID=2593676 RepID=UPI003409F079
MNSAKRLTDARRQDSARRRTMVMSALDQLAAHGEEITVSAVSRAAGVHRSLIYRHPDLHAALIARAASEPPPGTVIGPGASKQSLVTDIANLTDRIRRQDTHIHHLEQRLAEALGEQVWQQAGLGGPLDHDALQKRVVQLEEHIAELRQQLADRDDDLDAARAANRQLMASLNTAKDSA